ncbi:MAG TPA: histidine kinase dimerization/phospho-acceptor domain-containing protein, partial [Levilinea sp.]|nr:histidine kinase dimerization/phospho-acceptor domain-containing protein [Levilinea sp.]
MIERFFKWQRSLSVQVVTLLTGLIILTALAVGIPALWMLRDQLERQSWALAEQGRQTSQVILAKRRSDLESLAILTAQRLSLRGLIGGLDRPGLEPYLESLRQGAGVDVMLVCDAGGAILMQAGEPVGAGACLAKDRNVYVEPAAPDRRGWLLLDYPILETSDASRVVLGTRIDDDFARRLRDESGIEQILVFHGEYGASSFVDSRAMWNEFMAGSVLADDPVWLQGKTTFSFDGITYNLLRASLEDDDFDWIVALPVSHLLLVRQQLSGVIVAAILIAILLGSAIGILRTRQISRPLEELRDAAEDLRQGELSVPVRIESRIREVALLSYALDDARIALDHSLTELRQERDWSEHILESVVEGIITIDKRKRITFFSHGAERITGWQEDQVIGRSIDEILPLADEEGLFSQRLPLPGGKQKIAVRLRSGSPATLAVSGASLTPPEAGKAGIALVLRDVSNEEAIRRLLGDFLANISHEFRTPLSALAASIELLLDRLPDLEPHELRELLNNIHLGTISLQNLIDNLLEGASIETGRFQVWPKPCRAVDIIEEACMAIQPLVEKVGLVIRKNYPPDMPLVLADFRRTTQVVVNLLSNAVKWSPTGSEITITLLPEPDLVAVHVADRG